MHIFLDSSVLLAFCQSKKGASALILDYCRKRKLKGYICQKVIEEVQAQETTHNSKDSSIFASAKEMLKIQVMLSLDNGFFKDEVKEYLNPIEILKPGEFIQRFRSYLEN